MYKSTCTHVSGHAINQITKFHEYLVWEEANPHPHLIVYSHEWHHRHSDPRIMNKEYLEWNVRIYCNGLFGIRFCRRNNWKKSWQPSEFGMHCCNSAYQILSCTGDSHILEVNLKQNACPTLKKTNNWPWGVRTHFNNGDSHTSCTYMWLFSWLLINVGCTWCQEICWSITAFNWKTNNLPYQISFLVHVICHENFRDYTA